MKLKVRSPYAVITTGTRHAGLNALRRRVEFLDELHDVQTTLAKCRAHWRGRVSLACRDLQLDIADNLLCHFWLLNPLARANGPWYIRLGEPSPNLPRSLRGGALQDFPPPCLYVRRQIAYTSAMQNNAALLVIDVQNDFCTGGALAVPGGEAIVPLINRLAAKFATVVLTQDWHPANHISFAANHPGRQPFETTSLPYGEQVLWPTHCVQETQGAAFHADLASPTPA